MTEQSVCETHYFKVLTSSELLPPLFIEEEYERQSHKPPISFPWRGSNDRYFTDRIANDYRDPDRFRGSNVSPYSWLIIDCQIE